MKTLEARFSVVIPTLQRAKELRPLVDLCANHPLVHEVIVINNAPAPLHWDSPKVKVLSQPENIYVNPAWNLGAETATADYLAILNDDIMPKADLLTEVAGKLQSSRVGLIGLHPSCFKSQDPSDKWWRPAYERSEGFGVAMFLRRTEYHPIPEDMKIWYGDDWLFTRQKKRNWILGGFPVETVYATTSGDPRFNEVLQRDGAIWRAYPAGPYVRRFALEQRVVAPFKGLRNKLRGLWNR